MNGDRRRLLRGMSGLMLGSLLGGCGTASEGSLVIASHVWPGYELMFLARREGWLPASGLRLMETGLATDSLVALADGSADGAALTLDEVLQARAEGVPLTIVLVFDVSAGADVLIGRSHVRSLAGLAGKRIGVESTALGALMLHKILASAGLGMNEVRPVRLSEDSHRKAWERKDLDALITFEPTATQLIARGGHRLFDSREIPDTIFDVLAVRPEAADRHAEVLTGLIAGHMRALGHLRHNPQDAAYRMAERMELTADEVLNAYRGLRMPDLAENLRLLSPNPGGLLPAARELSRLMVDLGLISSWDDLAGLSSDAFLPGWR